MVDSANHILNVGRMLTEKKAELGHGNFMPWIKDNCDFTPRSAQRMITTANTTLASYLTDGESSSVAEDDAISISRQTWGHHNHLAQGTGENEWYTPLEYIELARTAMDGITLDPASSAKAQQGIQADNYFTEKDSGLEQPWYGNVWLNPPYSRDLIPAFIEKLVSELGNIDQAILLTHNYTDTRWFHAAEEHAARICFTTGRIRFLDEKGNRSAPTQGQAFFYFGRGIKKFEAAFANVGFIR